MPIDIKAANENFREFLRDLSPADKREVADLFKVTERTVQRWAKDPESGQQARNFIPERFWNREARTLPEKIQDRYNVSELANKGTKGITQDARKQGSFRESTKSLRNAIKYLRAMREKRLSAFESNTATNARLVRVPEGWEVQVEYAISYTGGSDEGVEPEWDHEFDDDYIEPEDEGKPEPDPDLGWPGEPPPRPKP